MGCDIHSSHKVLATHFIIIFACVFFFVCHFCVSQRKRLSADRQTGELRGKQQHRNHEAKSILSNVLHLLTAELSLHTISILLLSSISAERSRRSASHKQTFFPNRQQSAPEVTECLCEIVAIDGTEQQGIFETIFFNNIKIIYFNIVTFDTTAVAAAAAAAPVAFNLKHHEYTKMIISR